MAHKFTIELNDQEFDKLREVVDCLEEVERDSDGTEVFTYDSVLKDMLREGMCTYCQNYGIDVRMFFETKKEDLK